MVTVLAGLAEFERSLIMARTGEGRSRAMARGVKFGRKPKLTPHQISEALRRRDAGETLSESHLQCEPFDHIRGFSAYRQVHMPRLRSYLRCDPQQAAAPRATQV
jgi:hypothetical protein